MIIACPDCKGKLSTVAPRCPHCGYVQRPETPTAPSTAPAAPAGAPPPEFVPPSREVLQQAAKKQWRRWEQDDFWHLAFGAFIVLVVLGVVALTVTYLLHKGR